MKDGESGRRLQKVPYERPRILFREKMELMAVACTPVPPGKADGASCPIGPLSS
jgi:hypothetical protein